MQDLGARRLSRRRVSMWPLRSTRFPSHTVPEVLGRTSVGPQIFRPPSSGRSLVGGGAACTPQGTWSVPSGGLYGGIPEPYNGLSYAWGPGQTHSKRDGDLSLGCNPSGNSPPSPPGSCSMSFHPGNMIAGGGGIAPAYSRVTLLPVLLQCSLPSGRPADPTVSR